MSSLDFELDCQMSELEREWRQVYESSLEARTDYAALSANHGTSQKLLEMARDRMDRMEVVRARIMAKIERLEDSLLGRG